PSTQEIQQLQFEHATSAEWLAASLAFYGWHKAGVGRRHTDVEMVVRMAQFDELTAELDRLNPYRSRDWNRTVELHFQEGC
ncbi:hypothetical protein CEG88_26140, partial [Klebsiella aerogenes]|uniref:hypothetical protein n=1 Tax=Klebsiella aerogenes TaxID=548 RepID=UPI000B64FABE